MLSLGDAPGASKGEFVATTDQTEYLAKSPSKCSSFAPYIPANELIAAELAVVLAIPALPWVFIQMPSDELAFGSLRMPNTEFAPMSTDVADRLIDPDLFGVIAVFDLWIGNTDRHNGNLLGRRVVGGGSGSYQLLANDHSHALVREQFDPHDLDAVYAEIVTNTPERFYRCAELRARVEDTTLFRDALSKVEGIDDGVLRALVSGTPDDWMDGPVKLAVGDFLINRARNIRSLMSQVQHLFPRLAGVTL